MGGGLTYPDNLDDETEPDGKCSIKLTYDSFDTYSQHEEEIKELAKETGATFSVVKI